MPDSGTLPDSTPAPPKPESPAPKDDSPAFVGAMREEMERAARGSWQFKALEALEDLRGAIVQDAPAPVFEHFRGLRDAIREDSTGISPDFLPYPEDAPPATWKQGARTFDNTWEGRPNWRTDALAALVRVMDAIDIDAASAVYNEFGLLKEAVQGAKPPAQPE